jgi:hypothetical protein
MGEYHKDKMEEMDKRIWKCLFLDQGTLYSERNLESLHSIKRTTSFSQEGGVCVMELSIWCPYEDVMGLNSVYSHYHSQPESFFLVHICRIGYT